MNRERSAKMFLLLVTLWLPLGFFIWFYLASVFLAPVYLLAKAIFSLVLSAAFADLEMTRHLFTVVTTIQQPMGGGALGIIQLTINPMIYGFGLPLLAALVAATPLRWQARAVQLLTGFLAVIFVQVWGTLWEALKLLALESGPQGRNAVADLGLSLDAIAVAYQLGTLILPALTPVLVWVALNQAFIREFISPGPTAAND